MGEVSEQEITRIFAHEIRRKILDLLSHQSYSYSELLSRFNVSSSHLNYHLASMIALVRKEESSGRYILTPLGYQALNLLSLMKSYVSGDQSAPSSVKSSISLPVKRIEFQKAFSTEYLVVLINRAYQVTKEIIGYKPIANLTVLINAIFLLSFKLDEKKMADVGRELMSDLPPSKQVEIWFNIGKNIQKIAELRDKAEKCFETAAKIWMKHTQAIKVEYANPISFRTFHWVFELLTELYEKLKEVGRIDLVEQNEPLLMQVIDLMEGEDNVVALARMAHLMLGIHSKEEIMDIFMNAEIYVKTHFLKKKTFIAHHITPISSFDDLKNPINFIEQKISVFDLYLYLAYKTKDIDLLEELYQVTKSNIGILKYSKRDAIRLQVNVGRVYKEIGRYKQAQEIFRKICIFVKEEFSNKKKRHPDDLSFLQSSTLEVANTLAQIDEKNLAKSLLSVLDHKLDTQYPFRIKDSIDYYILLIKLGIYTKENLMNDFNEQKKLLNQLVLPTDQMKYYQILRHLNDHFVPLSYHVHSDQEIVTELQKLIDITPRSVKQLYEMARDPIIYEKPKDLKSEVIKSFNQGNSTTTKELLQRYEKELYSNMKKIPENWLSYEKTYLKNDGGVLSQNLWTIDHQLNLAEVYLIIGRNYLRKKAQEILYTAFSFFKDSGKESIFDRFSNDPLSPLVKPLKVFRYFLYLQVKYFPMEMREDIKKITMSYREGLILLGLLYIDKDLSVTPQILNLLHSAELESPSGIYPYKYGKITPTYWNLKYRVLIQLGEKAAASEIMAKEKVMRTSWPLIEHMQKGNLSQIEQNIDSNLNASDSFINVEYAFESKDFQRNPLYSIAANDRRRKFAGISFFNSIKDDIWDNTRELLLGKLILQMEDYPHKVLWNLEQIHFNLLLLNEFHQKNLLEKTLIRILVSLQSALTILAPSELTEKIDFINSEEEPFDYRLLIRSFLFPMESFKIARAISREDFGKICLKSKKVNPDIYRHFLTIYYGFSFSSLVDLPKHPIEKKYWDMILEDVNFPPLPEEIRSKMREHLKENSPIFVSLLVIPFIYSKFLPLLDEFQFPQLREEINSQLLVISDYRQKKFIGTPFRITQDTLVTMIAKKWQSDLFKWIKNNVQQWMRSQSYEKVIEILEYQNTLLDNPIMSSEQLSYSLCKTIDIIADF